MMHNPDQLPAEHTDDDHVEIVDLDALQPPDDEKDSAKRSAADRPLLSFVRQRSVQVAATSTILLVALVIWVSVSGAFSWLAAQANPDSAVLIIPTQVGGVYTPQPVSLQDGLACLVDASWAPDSQQVAVLGYGQNCPLMPGPSPSLQVNIYNAGSHQLVKRMRLDPMIASAFKRHDSQPLGSAYVNLGNITWSPDGQGLAVSFSTDVAGFVYDGVVLITSNGREQRVMLWQDNRQDATSSYLEWDLTRGAPKVVYYSKQLTTSLQNVSIVNLPPAPAYRWGANGALEPVSRAENGPIGNPDGDPMFTVWQPGFVELQTQQPPDGPALPVKFSTWSTQFTVWSPDGRYFIDQVNTTGRFVVPHRPIPSHQELAALGMDQLATLATRDKALAGILVIAWSGQASEAYIAWRPDGRELATYNAGQIDIYDCATGRKLASLIPPGKPSGLNGAETFSWSPDGSRLMLSSPVWGALTTWGPGQLPG